MAEFYKNRRGHLEAVCASFLNKFELDGGDEEAIIFKTYNCDTDFLCNWGKVRLGTAKRIFGDNWIRLAYKHKDDAGVCTIIVDVREKRGRVRYRYVGKN